ncbi:unnamed protein product [Phyllotreta striolata]|uniref:MoaB/Mog domain-containing protein n=1 Tax=Phyllotreta striolata TaxID=444603 RepID=A0A9N9TXK3_PHYSR|nr:unnamed protein product [Phyllotreta striolata]
MLGKTNILVYKRPSIGVISIGNNICEPKEKLAPGKIRDANRFTLINLLKNFHYEANDCGIAKDNPDAIKHALEQSFTCNDVIITNSLMGELDMLKRVLVEDFQANIYFCRIKMKPGHYKADMHAGPFEEQTSQHEKSSELHHHRKGSENRAENFHNQTSVSSKPAIPTNFLKTYKTCWTSSL